MMLKDIFEQATEHRQSFMNVSEPQDTWKDRLWHYCCVWDCSPKFTKLQVGVCVCVCVCVRARARVYVEAVSDTHLRAHET